MIKPTLVALTGLALSATAAAQDASLAEDSRTVRGVTIADIQALITAEGHTVQSSDTDEVTVSAITTSDLKFAIDGTACNDDKHCLGVNMFVHYTGAESMSDSDIIAQNVQYAAASVWRSEGSLGVSRYIILDGGMTMENLKVNLRTLLAIAPKVHTNLAGSSATTTGSADSINYGDDSGGYANDGTCDDARFRTDGDSSSYKRQHVLKDATDCRNDVADGTYTLLLDFGDDSGDYANDGECDDSRFDRGPNPTIESDSHVLKDATDCITAYRAGDINRPSLSTKSSDGGSIEFGNDDGDYANDGTCDDARFSENGDEYQYKRNHVLKDATDCQFAVNAGTVSLLLDFGDDSGSFAQDDECDDIRFSGRDNPTITSDSHVLKDKTDCLAAYIAGSITR